ncbi:MAG: hypothetical protein O4861_20450 [Trichodesmium sp. St16_bin4-tuft]|nr:hypothetical protein [Trichodesmium sp. MAG_R01]MDE5074154.1 hypothetical protein [Trichodesmium sp. St5_bin8]MDE5078046.1 hypothetical protein [Trichodesmium sp. St2_bin6]MDE5100574.1 hypothetical protein [Trichodesmium sp. St16_bin4-tuft]MDE5104194.1 hypothetical protein [Trichodesmium sp. St19_bin2]
MKENRKLGFTGFGKHRTWGKLYLGVNVGEAFRRKATGKILTVIATTNNVADEQV